jgi:hypothetical protein
MMQRIIVKNSCKIGALLIALAGLSMGGHRAYAAACTSIATSAWNVQTTWGAAGVGCVGATGGIPGAADTVTIASPNTVTLDAARTVTSLTINSGATLTLNTNLLTVTGNVIINGILDDNTAGGAGGVNVTGNASVISGGGTLTGEARLYTSGTTPSVAAGTNLTFTAATQFRAGRNAGTTVAASVLTINGTLTSTVAGAGNFLRLYANSTIISTTGVISATPSEITFQTNTATLTNNGVVTILNAPGGNASNTWTNAANSTLNVGGTLMTTGTLSATATGNTVNYSGAAQTGKVTTYNNLTLSGSAAKTFATTPTVNNVLSMEGTATVVVTTGVVTYGTNATLRYNTASARTVSSEEWIPTFAGSGGVVVANTGAITLNAAKVLDVSVPLTINTGATLATGNFQVSFGGNFVNGGTFTAGSSPIVIENAMAAQSIAGFTTTGAVSMTKTAGTATFTGNVGGAGLTVNGTGGTLSLGTGLAHTFTGAWTRTAGTLQGGSSTLNIGGSCSGTGGTFTAETSTVNWNAAGAQTVCAVSYYNLTLSNSGAKTMTSVTSIGNNLTIAGTATMTSNAAFTVTGALNYSSTASTTLSATTAISIGTFNQSAGTLIDNGNTITVTGTGANTWTKSAGTFTATGTVVFTGAAPQIGASNFNNLTIDVGASNTATLTGIVTPSGNLTVSTGTFNLSTFAVNRSAAGGTIAVSNGATLEIGGTNTFPANYTTTTLGATSTVLYDGTAQTVAAKSYGNLTLATSGVKTMTGVTSISGALSISGTATMTGNAAFTVTGALNYSSTGSTTLAATTAISIGSYNQSAGTLIDNGNTITVTGTGANTWVQSGGTFTPTGNVTFTGTAPQIGAANFNNLTINVGVGNSATLTGNATVSSVLTLTSGLIATGSNILEVTSDCTTATSGATATSYVVGNLRLHYPTNAGTTTCTFPVGSAGAYSRATVAMLNVTSSLANSILTARTDAGDHADTTASSAGIDSAKSVNRYWTLTGGGSLTFSTYNVTLTFVAGDIDGGANTANFVISRKSGGAWTYPTIGTRSATDTSATGITQTNGFGEFVIGERAFPSLTILKSATVYSDPYNNTTNAKAIPGAILSYTIKLTNSGYGTVDNNTVVITDNLPSNLDLFVGDIAGAGPVVFADGTPASGLSWTFTSLSSGADSVDFSQDGSNWAYTPVPDGNGFDSTVRHIRFKPSGTMNGAAGGNKYFDLLFRVRIH